MSWRGIVFCVPRMTSATPRDNNFDLLRLVFAGSVFFWRLYVLSRAPALEIFSHVFSANIAVKGFFVISGYLVMMSYENSSSIREYAEKRLRRIYPAYAAVVLACAIAGAFFSALPLAEYAGAGLLRYLAANLAFLNFLAPSLPGVFEGQPVRGGERRALDAQDRGHVLRLRAAARLDVRASGGGA